MSELQNQIADRVKAFVEDIANLARKTAIELLSGTKTPDAPVVIKRKPGRPPKSASVAAPAAAAPAAAKPAPKAPKAAKGGGRGAKRTGPELDKLVARVLKQIQDNPGQRMEHINKAIGLPTKDLVLPIKKLVSEGKIRSTGTRRSTQYFGADPAAKKGPGKKK